MIKRVIAAIAFVVFGLFVSIGYSAVAQTGRTTAPSSTSSPSTSSPSTSSPSTSSPSTSSPSTSSPSSSQVSDIDRAFVTEAAQAGAGNIMLGQLALQKSKNDRVRQFAQAEIQEQTQVAKDLSSIAPKLGITLPTSPGPKQQAAMEQLSQLESDRFDSAYMNEGGVNAHLENAALFQREAAFGQNQDLVAVADKGLPIIRQHFQTASAATNYQFGQVAQRFNNVSSNSGASSQ